MDSLAFSRAFLPDFVDIQRGALVSVRGDVVRTGRHPDASGRVLFALYDISPADKPLIEHATTRSTDVCHRGFV